MRPVKADDVELVLRVNDAGPFAIPRDQDPNQIRPKTALTVRCEPFPMSTIIDM